MCARMKVDMGDAAEFMTGADMGLAGDVLNGVNPPP